MVVGGLHLMVSRELADVILSHEQLLSLAILACPSKRASIYLLQLPNHVSYPPCFSDLAEIVSL